MKICDCRKTCEGVQISVYARSSQWGNSITVYAGAFVLLVHFALHASVHIAARLTVGICFVAEAITLVVYLNNCLRFKVIFNRKFFPLLKESIRLLLGILCILLFSYAFSKLWHVSSSLTSEEILLIFTPSIYCLSIAAEGLMQKHTPYASYISLISLTMLFCVYW